jgi:outer membrane biosynthesis protein TonB
MTSAPVQRVPIRSRRIVFVADCLALRISARRSLSARWGKNEKFCTFSPPYPTRLATTSFVVTSYPRVVWQPNCAQAGSTHIPPELPLFPQRILVALETDQGVEYITASGWDRVYLLWMFRNFRSLPQNVLSARQKQLIGSLYREASNYSSDELHGAVVAGRVEDFRPSALATLPSSVKTGKRVAREESLPDVPTLGSKPFYARLTLNRMTLKVASTAVVLAIAILAWHQLRAQPVAGSSSTQTAAAARRRDEPLVTARPAVAQDVPQKDPIPASVEPAVNPAVAAPLTDTGSSREVTTAQVGTAAPAVHRSGAPPAHSVPQDITAPAQTLAVSKTNETAAIIHHPVTPSPKISVAVADLPRVQISGRPQKLVYPVCPETQARGKVSLQAVVEYDGAVSRVRILTGDRTLAAAAIEAVRQWRYEPFSGIAPRLERETNITISFISNEVVAVSFPNSAPLSR